MVFSSSALWEINMKKLLKAGYFNRIDTKGIRETSGSFISFPLRKMFKNIFRTFQYRMTQK